MIEKRQIPTRWLYSLVVLIILIGCLMSAWIFKAAPIWKYPAMISDAYDEQQHRLLVPGSTVVKLTRTGAYGVYYEYSPVASTADHARMPPAINCTLTSKSTGATMDAAPDYVETNRYWSNDPRDTGVLIMSFTVNEPDIYTFACHYRDDSTKPEINVALGPNYVWEFLRVSGKIGLSLLAAMTTVCGSLLMGSIIIVIVAIKRRG